jgi:hypothetical protein
MKKIKNIIFGLSILILFSCNDNNKEQKITASTRHNQIEVLDFYGKHRCKACISIEEKTKFTIETYFKTQVDKGLLSFKVIEIDKEINATITEEYGAYGTSLFLNVIKDGKETHIDLTNFAFKKESNKDIFVKELQNLIQNELNKL